MFKKIYAVGVSLVLLLSMVGCGGGGSSSGPATPAPAPAPAPSAESLLITAVSKSQGDSTQMTVIAGLAVEYMAQIVGSDGSKKDVSQDVQWHSSNLEIASVERGVVTGNSEGSIELHASLGELSSNAASIAVVQASLVDIQVAAVDQAAGHANVRIPVGMSQRYSALGHYDNDAVVDITSLVAWSLDNDNAALIAPGVIEGVTVGLVDVTASKDRVNSNIAHLEITDAVLTAIQVTPAVKELAKGYSLAYTAMGSFSDNSSLDISSSVIWASDNTAVASIDASGLARTVNPGVAEITASQAGVGSNIAALTVTDAALVSLKITPLSATFAKGNQLQLNAMATFSDQAVRDVTQAVIWDSSTLGVSIDAAGLARGLAVGTVNVTASNNGIISNEVVLSVTPATLVSLEVTPVSATVAKGSKQQYFATGRYTDNSTADLTATVN